MPGSICTAGRSTELLQDKKRACLGEGDRLFCCWYGQGVVQAHLVGLADDALRQGLGVVCGKQDDVNLIGHVDAVLFGGAEHLQVHYVGIAHRAVVDIVAAAHQRAAFIGQFRGISHG